MEPSKHEQLITKLNNFKERYKKYKLGCEELEKQIIALDKELKKVDASLSIYTTPGGNYKPGKTYKT